MKKIVSILLILAALLGIIPAGAQESEVLLLTGTILETAEDSVMLDVPEMGEVQAWVNEDTVLEGVDALRAGQTAVVLYDGKMTRSLPPQITALRIGVYAVEGTITEIAEDSVTILRGDDLGEVIVTLPEGAPELTEGQHVIAYTNGIMTMSLPPIMNAIAFETEFDESEEDVIAEEEIAEAIDVELILEEDVTVETEEDLIPEEEEAGDEQDVSGEDRG